MNIPPPSHTAKKQRGRARDAAPFVSLRPWAGFTAHQSPRALPLPVCPSPRCRRARACIAALDDLYCQRTHHGLDELRRQRLNSPLQRELDSVLPVLDETDLSERMERIAALAEIRRAYVARMLALWKAGGLGPGFHKFRSAGVIMRPPLKTYAESASKPPQKRGGQAPKRDV